MEENQIRIAFSKVKQDILFLTNELTNLKQEMSEIKDLLRGFHEEINTQKLHEIAEKKPEIDNTTLRHINTTHPVTSTHNTTLRQEIEGLKYPNLGISTGNEGVSTDRQTDTSTDKNTAFLPEKDSLNIESNIIQASEILDSLDRLKKEIRLKFKRVTPQEMAVFSTIYQLEEHNPPDANYKHISNILKLSQSSIRDYVQRMIDKGIPIKKQKINNKMLILSISPELKKIATLSTIIKLREL